MGVKKFFFSLFYIKVKFEALVANPDMGDAYGDSYYMNSEMTIPRYVFDIKLFIKDKIQSDIIKNKELSQVITVEIKEIS